MKIKSTWCCVFIIWFLGIIYSSHNEIMNFSFLIRVSESRQHTWSRSFSNRADPYKEELWCPRSDGVNLASGQLPQNSTKVYWQTLFIAFLFPNQLYWSSIHWCPQKLRAFHWIVVWAAVSTDREDAKHVKIFRIQKI